MKKLDKFFKNKLDDRQVPFEETYWEDALAMLDARDKRKRKGAFWWWLGSGLVLVAIATVVCFPQTKHSTPDSISRKNIINDGAVAENAIKRDKEVLSNDKTTIEKPIITNTSKQNVEPTIVDRSSSLKKETKQANKKETDTNTKRTPEVELPIVETTLVSEEKHQSTNFLNKESIPISLPVAAITDLDSATAIIEKEENKEQSSIVVEDRTLIELFPPIPVKSFTVIFEESVPRLADQENETILSIQQTNKLQWSFGVGAMLNPSTAKRLLGGDIGLMVAYPLKQKMAIYARTAYRRQGGTFGTIQESKQINFRFGVAEERFSLQASHLHYITSSIGLSKQWQKHQVGVGLAHQYLLSVRGELTSTSKGEFTTSFLSPTTKNSGWLDEKGFFKNVFGAEFYYQFQVQNRLGLVLKLNYWPSSLLNDDINIPDELRLQEHGPVFIDFGINYRL